MKSVFMMYFSNKYTAPPSTYCQTTRGFSSFLYSPETSPTILVMKQIHFLTHSDTLMSPPTLEFLNEIQSEHPDFLWLLDHETTALKVYDWLWKQDQWLVCDTIENHHGGIALCWPTLALPSNLPLINHSPLSIESMSNSPKYELVTQNNTEEMRKRYLFYKKNGINITLSKR